MGVLNSLMNRISNANLREAKSGGIKVVIASRLLSLDNGDFCFWGVLV